MKLAFTKGTTEIGFSARAVAFTFLIIFFSGTLLGQSKVKITEQPVVIPTYQVAPPTKAPIFYSGRTYQGAQGHIYPHPMYDVLTDNKKDETYKIVYVENEYTKIGVAPQLGGRILSAVDKTNQYDFFYHQHVIKPALIGMIGAWLSGGVEWNIPDHHRASSNLPIDYSMEENPDDSKTVWVGETELSRGLKWIVGLTLHPGKSYIDATVKIFNPTPFAQSFLYWANVSVHANKDYQVIFPPSTQFGVQHAKNEFIHWPIGEEVYDGIDYTGVDLSWWKNYPKPVSIFAWNFTDDFLAGYDHGKEAGTVHVANHHIVEGKKFFEWGNNAEAEMWRKNLTDSDGHYLELMVGAYSNNQPDYSWIAPGETRVFHQYWYPIKKIGGVKEANVDAAVNLERKSPKIIEVGFNTTSAIKQAKVVITLKDKAYAEETINISPENPVIKQFSIDPSVDDTDIKVGLLDQSGRELISYSPVQLKDEKMPEPVEVPRPPKEYNSNQELYLTGLRLEQFRNAAIDPMPYYEEALSRDSLDYLVNNKLGMRYSKNGRFIEAEKFFDRAIRRLTKNYTHPKDGEAFYNLGVALQFQNRLQEAKDAFWKATWYNGVKSSAYFRLGQIVSLENDYDQALKLIDRSLVTNNLNTSTLALKAYILRKNGKLGQAKEVVLSAQNIDKLDHWSVAESYFINAEESGQKKWNDQSINSFKSRMGGNVQSVLELALNYGNAGAYEEALSILDQFKQLGEKQSDFPMLSYYEGFYKWKKGDKQAAEKYFKEAGQASPDYCFPFRLEEIEILETALATNPEDAKAWYYLGNLHYFLEQKKKAIDDWEKSVELDDNFYLPFRNLGFAYHEVSNDLEKAISAYEKAIAINDQDPRLFAESDVLKEAVGISPTERLSFLEKHKAVVEKRDDATKQLVELYNITGAYDKALNIITTRHFHVWEGSGNTHLIFTNTNLLRGISGLQKKQYAKALEDFQRAATYPENLEIGKPYDGGRSAQVNYYIALANAGLKNKSAAREYYQKAAQAENLDIPSELSFYKAMALKKLGKTEDAALILDELQSYAHKQLTSEEMDFFSKFGEEISRKDQMANAHYLLGLAYYGQDDTEKAMEQFRKAVELNQNHVWAKLMQNSNLI